jgi:lysophospholipase L1-like esterase
VTQPVAGSAAGSHSLRYLALGDSYTIGERVAVDERWPNMLAGLLRRDGVVIEPPRIIAVTGWTTDELSAGMDRAHVDGERYDLVSLLIGVNNQFRGHSAEGYRQEFRVLLQRAVRLGGGDPGQVLVLSIPDWGVTPFAARLHHANIGAEIDQFNTINREETETAKARYIDVTPISREAAVQPSLLAIDGLHPSAEMYQRWAELALPAAREALQ